MDDLRDGVQPPEGQGAGAAGDPPYADYLNRIPEEHRPVVEPIFREWDGNVTKRFQAAAEQQQQWAPYEQAGIRQVPADELQGWLQFRQAAMENPQAIQQWYDQYAQANGLTAQEAAQQQQTADQFVDPDLDSLLQQRLEAALGPIQQQVQQFQSWQEQQDQARAEEAARAHIESQIAELETKHGDRFNREGVESFLANHLDQPETAVAKAFDQYQAFVANIEKQVLKSKTEQPAGAEAGGGTAAAGEPVRDLRQAGDLAKEQLRQMFAR